MSWLFLVTYFSNTLYVPHHNLFLLKKGTYPVTMTMLDFSKKCKGKSIYLFSGPSSL